MPTLARSAVFGKTNAVSPLLDPADTRLLETEKRVRLFGEFFAFIGLLCLILGLFLWQPAGSRPYDFNGLIHVPDILKAVLHFDLPVVREQKLEPVLLVPAGYAFLSTLLFFIVGSALLRRRFRKVACLLALFLLPWPLFGLLLPASQTLAHLILIGALPVFAWRRQWRFLLVNIAALYLTFSYFNVMLSVAEKRTAGGWAFQASALEARQSDQDRSFITSFEQVAVTTEAQAVAKAYVVAQEAYLLQNIEGVRAQLRRAELHPAKAGSIEARRLATMKQYAAGVEAASSDSETGSGRIVAKVLVFLAACGLAVGLSIEALGTRILRRKKRMAAVAEKIDALKTATGQTSLKTGKLRLEPMEASVPLTGRERTTDNSAIASLPKQLHRRSVRTALFAAPFIGLAFAALILAWFFHAPPVEDNQAFSQLHILKSVSQSFAELATTKFDEFRVPSLARSLVAILLGIAGLVYLMLRRVRMAIALFAIVMVGSVYQFAQFGKAGLFEVNPAIVSPRTLLQLEQTSRADVPSPGPASGDEKQRKQIATAIEAANYTLAQIGYLQNKPEQTRLHLNRLTQLDSKLDSVRWRLAFMQEWLAAKGMPVAETAYRVRPVVSQALQRRISQTALISAFSLMGMGLVILSVSGVQFYRKQRISKLIYEFQENVLRRRALA